MKKLFQRMGVFLIPVLFILLAMFLMPMTAHANGILTTHGTNRYDKGGTGDVWFLGGSTSVYRAYKPGSHGGRYYAEWVDTGRRDGVDQPYTSTSGGIYINTYDPNNNAIEGYNVYVYFNSSYSSALSNVTVRAQLTRVYNASSPYRGFFSQGTYQGQAVQDGFCNAWSNRASWAPVSIGENGDYKAYQRKAQVIFYVNYADIGMTPLYISGSGFNTGGSAGTNLSLRYIEFNINTNDLGMTHNNTAFHATLNVRLYKSPQIIYYDNSPSDCAGKAGSTPRTYSTDGYWTSRNPFYLKVSNNGFIAYGYTFTGWNTKADGSGTSYSPGDIITSSGNDLLIKLYAQWEITPTTLTIDANGGLYNPDISALDTTTSFTGASTYTYEGNFKTYVTFR